MYTVTLQRTMNKRTNTGTLDTQINKIIGRATAGRFRTWRGRISRKAPVLNPRGEWVFEYEIVFEKSNPRSTDNIHWQAIKDRIEKAGSHACFAGKNWVFKQENRFVFNSNVLESQAEERRRIAQRDEEISRWPDGLETHASTEIAQNTWAIKPVIKPSIQAAKPVDFSDVISGDDGITASLTDIFMEKCKSIIHKEKPKTWEELVVPPELLGAESDKYLSEHEAWKNIYGVNAQIRIILSNIKRAQETNGESRNHSVLFGHAGCGKTTTMFALEKMFGKESILKLDATSTTKAGLEKLFFGELTNVPPIVIMEEAEKADPEALKIWLGALDDRGEIRKINYKVNQLRQVKVLFICSVNNKNVFDRMMGSDGTQAGAFSSRCVSQVYFPRPNDAILHQILEKEIKEKGGNLSWIDPAVKMASDLGVTDPRIVKSYLAGGDRLLDGTYQKDWLLIHEAQKNFNK